jgi:hypothetical protein
VGILDLLYCIYLSVNIYLTALSLVGVLFFFGAGSNRGKFGNKTAASEFERLSS